MKKKVVPITLVTSLIFAAVAIMTPVVLAQQYGPRTPNMLIHIYFGPDAEFAALENCEIDIISSPLTKNWIDRWILGPDGIPNTGDELYPDQIMLYSYVALDNYDLDLNNQRWPTGVTMPRSLDPSTGTYKHWYGTNEWDDEARAFRHAIAHLTPKDRIITEILNGTGFKKETPVPYPALAGWTDYAGLEAKGLIHHYDPVEAAFLLDAAGFVQGSTSNPYYDPATPGSAQYIRTDPRYGGDLQELLFYIREDDPLRRESGLLLTTELRKAGIPVNPIMANRTQALQQVMVLYDYHLYTGSWDLNADVDFLYDLFHSSMYWGGTDTSYYDGLGWSYNYIGFAHNYTQDQGLAGPVGAETDYLDYWAQKLKYTSATFDDVYQDALNVQEIHAKLVANIPLWSSLVTKAYKTGWEGTVNKEGEGKDNYWSFLNMSNPDDDTIDWGFPTNIESLNIITAEWYWDRRTLRQIYDSLIGRNPYNLAEDFGWLAEHWEVGFWEPGRIYGLFRLRQDNPSAGTRAPVFHNGDSLRPLDVAFSLIFTRDCGPGVAWFYSNVKDIVKVEIPDPVPSWLVGTDIEQNTALGPREVKIYFDTQSYWTLHRVGFVPIFNERIWRLANDNLGWGYNTPAWDPMAILMYNPWEEDSDSDGTVDLAEDGTGAWIFTGYAPPGPISAATSIALVANTNFYLSQDYIANYLTYAFHNVGDINEDGVVDMVDYEILERAMGTNMWDYPWGTGWGEYNPDADINTCSWDMVNGIPSYGDGYIDVRDLGVWAKNYGSSSDGVIMDIAITDVAPQKGVVGSLYPVNITVTVENQGGFKGESEVSVYLNGSLLDSQTTSPDAGTSINLNFTWNTTDFAKGNYIISAYATRFPGEIDTADNNYVDGIVTVTIPGDIDGDGYVGSADASVLSGKYGSSVGDPIYKPEADIDCDGYIGSADASILSGKYGQTDP